MLAALAIVIPLGLGGAVSPVMLTEQTVLLAGPDGRRAGLRYAAGVVLTSIVIVLAFVLFGRAISLPTEPHLDASLDLVVGFVLVLVAAVILGLGRRRDESPSAQDDDDRGGNESRQSRAAFPFGVFSMATNLTTLALIAAAAKTISRTNAEVAATTLSLPHPYLDGMAEAWIASHRPSWETRTKVTYEDVIEYAILRRDSQAGRDVGPA